MINHDLVAKFLTLCSTNTNKSKPKLHFQLISASFRHIFLFSFTLNLGQRNQRKNFNQITVNYEDQFFLDIDIFDEMLFCCKNQFAWTSWSSSWSDFFPVQFELNLNLFSIFRRLKTKSIFFARTNTTSLKITSVVFNSPEAKSTEGEDVRYPD